MALPRELLGPPPEDADVIYPVGSPSRSGQAPSEAQLRQFSKELHGRLSLAGEDHEGAELE